MLTHLPHSDHRPYPLLSLLIMLLSLLIPATVLIDLPPPPYYYDMEYFCMFAPLPHSDLMLYPLLSFLIMHLLPLPATTNLIDLPSSSSSLLQFTAHLVPRFAFLSLPFPRTYNNHAFHFWLIL